MVSIVEALADCLEAMRKGKADVEACLDRYPAYRAELKALLEVASLIRPLPDDVVPPPEFRDSARRQLLPPVNGDSDTERFLDPNAGPA